ncbi:WG repeat-containing protein [Micromonospora sp. NPDC049559]|uniref:WG repeat-containing protein n=1 Tax=Micromonospora sp. NPDC049559 TaxID=3155923 RepID=UPI0034327218
MPAPPAAPEGAAPAGEVVPGHTDDEDAPAGAVPAAMPPVAPEPSAADASGPPNPTLTAGPTGAPNPTPSAGSTAAPEPGSAATDEAEAETAAEIDAVPGSTTPAADAVPVSSPPATSETGGGTPEETEPDPAQPPVTADSPVAGAPATDVPIHQPPAADPPVPGVPDGPSLAASADAASTDDKAPSDLMAVNDSPADEGTSPDDTPVDDPAPAPAPSADSSPPSAVEVGPDEVAEASPDTVLPAPAGPAAGAATALRAPTMLTPIVSIGESATAPAPAPPTETPAEEPAPPAADPEQVLATYEWRFHHETLRELVENPDELRTIRDRLTEKLDGAVDNRSRARLLSLRAVVSRILGDLGKALTDARLALTLAEATGELRRIAIAQARLAHVLQWRGDFAEADRLFEEANSSELPDRLRATMHEHAGRSCYDQGRYIEACNHFERALELRKVEDPDLIARTELALDAVFNKVAENGWGPYPRGRDEILQVHRPPVPKFSERVQRWGYADPDGQLAIAPSYADVQPFRDGVAWVRRPETETWELIDESGELLIQAAAGYLGVGSFSDGLAWVSRDGTGSWIAIDKSNKVVISIGFDDVRPFRRGVAAVRRGGGWGAVDKSGQIVVPNRYTGFVTALTDGRYLDGFTDEGLAIVDSGGRKGVVDRTGRVIVPPAHPALVIHPVAFLIGSGTGQWGALDRRGEPLIDVVHPSRTDVMDEIDRLLADTKPVL